MAIYKIFPEKDTTLYSAYPTQNTGLDSIIESSTTVIPSNAQSSRFIIKFSTTEINNTINNIISGSVTDSTGSLLTSSKDFESNLKSFIAEVNGLSNDTTLEIYPMADAWVMGTGKLNDDPITIDGSSWVYKDGSNQWTTTGYPSGVTGSYPSDNPGGGAWHFGVINGLNINTSQNLSYADDKDLNVNVTNAIKLIYSGSLTNEGFIIKQSPTSEFINQKAKAATLKYFSVDTHTIYPPQLEFKWRDYMFDTGSSNSEIINTSQLVATLDNNGKYFRKDSIHKFYINCRPQFPVRKFQTSSLYTTNYYLPTSSYYAIKDLDTNEFVIDFDTNYTQISANSEGSYFKLYMNGLEPERYYQVILKTFINGETLILDNDYYFKIING